MRIEALLIEKSGGIICEKLASPKYPQNVGKIRCVGGRREPVETPADTIIRELKEEYGIKILRTDIGEELGPGRIGTRRFAVSAPIGIVGRASLEGGWSQLVRVAADAVPEMWQREEAGVQAYTATPLGR